MGFDGNTKDTIQLLMVVNNEEAFCSGPKARKSTLQRNTVIAEEGQHFGICVSK